MATRALLAALVLASASGCVAELDSDPTSELGSGSDAVTYRRDGDVLVVANDAGRYWIALDCIRGPRGDIGPGYIHQASVRLASGERVRTRDLNDLGMSDARNGGWAKFGLHLYRPDLAAGDPGVDGRFRIVEGGVCAGAHPGWPYFGAGVSRGWLESRVRRNASGEVAFAVGVELSDGHFASPMVRLVYRYRIGRDYVRVWTSVTTLCPNGECGGRAYVKEPKFTVSDAAQDDPYTSITEHDDAGAVCASMSGAGDPRRHTEQCASARRANALFAWGGDCSRGCLRVRARSATRGTPDDGAPLSTLRLWGTDDLLDCDSTYGLDRWACLSTHADRNPHFPSPSASCSRGINAFRRWEAVRWQPDPDGNQDTQAGFHAWEGGWGLDDCVNLYRSFGPTGESFFNYFSFRYEGSVAPPSTDDDAPSCSDACARGEKRCLDGDAYVECADADGDGCTEWSAAMSCAGSWPGTVCDAGYCVGSPAPHCTDACASGEKRCVDGDAYVECTDADGDGCTEWSAAMSCAGSWPGTVCDAGYCVGSPEPPPPPPPPPATCGELGASCASGECCDGLACAGAATTCCRPVQSACGSTTECCAGRLCVAGQCCVVLRDGCSSDEQCCNHPAHVCQAGRCCVAAGQGCSMDDQCCSGDCASGRCR